MNEEIKYLDNCFGEIPLTNENLNCIAQYGWQKFFGDDTYTFGYINSYKMAGDSLVDKEVPDLLIYPIMFCYRHYLEQVLKNICKKHMKRREYRDFIYVTSHNILKIWKDAKKYLEGNNSVDDIEFVQEMVCWFNVHDPDSFVFRYETDKKNKKNIKEDLLSIDTLRLKKNIEKVDVILRYTYDSI